ncbi:MAG: efflux RND transporter periplasmic adaptor subunit [Myxococcota bacterium]
MHDGPQPNRRLLRGLLIATAVLVLAGIALRLTAPKPPPVAAAGEGASAIEVRTLAVAFTPRRDRAVLSGVLEAKRRVRLSAETNGRVLEVGAEELDPVEAEQVLVRIDPLRARVAVERAAAAVTRAESELSLARTSLERQQSLKERDVTSESAFDDASNRRRVAQASIRDARAQLEHARDELARKTIRAPFAGVLASFEVEPGEYVREGQELGELLDLSTARTTLGLSDRQVVGVVPGARVPVRVEALPNEVFDGRVLRVGVAAERDSRKFPVEVEIRNDARRLLPGMIARVELDLGTDQDRIVVPREALIEEFDLRFVYVVERDEDGALRARQRRVSTRDLPFDPGHVEVIDGLESGERVAVGGVQSLRNGALVRGRDLAAPARAGGDPEPGAS